MAQIFFESYQTQAFFIAIQGVLSLYASGKTTGVVLDSGDGVTHCVPVFEGFSLEHAFQRIDLGGRDISQHLLFLLRKAGHTFTTTAEFEIVKKIKEKRCQLSPQNIQEEKFLEQYGKNKDPYYLPDGEVITLSSEKNLAPEILFNPENIGLEYPSISELLISSIKKTDIDLRKTLYKEIVLAGGTTLMNGFPERFIYEVRKISPKDVFIKIYAPPERIQLCWTGGSILSNLASFRNMWITKAEYEEEGEKILLKKTL